MKSTLTTEGSGNKILTVSVGDVVFRSEYQWPVRAQDTLSKETRDSLTEDFLWSYVTHKIVHHLKGITKYE